MADENGVEARNTLITDKRSVSMGVANAPEHRTPGGRTPIAPTRLLIEMWISPWRPDELTIFVEIAGPRLEEPKRGQFLKRRLALDDAPEWARRLAGQHRPDWAPLVVSSG